MAYKAGSIVIASEELNLVMDRGLRDVDRTPRDNRTRIQRNSMTDTSDGGSGGGDVGYNSYFKIVDSSITNEDGSVVNMISVVDGRDRGTNCVKVNNKVHYIAYLSDQLVSKSVIVALCFSSAENTVTYSLIADSVLPDDTAEFSWYQIGEVLLSNESLIIYQDHLSGIAQMFWYDVCGE